MSKGGGSQTTKVKLPKWVDQASRDNYQFAQDVANRPYNPYTGERIAGFNDIQQQGMQDSLDFANGNVGGAALGDAMSYMRGVGDFSPEKIAAGIDTYMNPYLDKVAGNVMSNMDRSRQMALMNGGAAATTAGAYGGSRQGIADALTNSEFFRNAGQQMDQLYSQGFDRAAGLSAQDIANSMNAQGLRLSAGSQLANLGNMERQWGLQNLGLINQVGAQQQGMDQAMKDWQYQQFLEQRDYPLQQLGIRQSGLSASPYGQATTASGGGTNPFGSALGGALTGASLFGTGGALAGLGGIGGMGGAGLGALAGLLL